jgi:hypothetical protein
MQYAIESRLNMNSKTILLSSPLLRIKWSTDLSVLFQFLVEYPHETSDNRHQKMETSSTTHRTSFSSLQEHLLTHFTTIA